jgi:hypothetical protein
MKRNYIIHQVNISTKPFFIVVCNFIALNEIFLFNKNEKQTKGPNRIGQWIIKYKN